MLKSSVVRNSDAGAYLYADNDGNVYLKVWNSKASVFAYVLLHDPGATSLEPSVVNIGNIILKKLDGSVMLAND